MGYAIGAIVTGVIADSFGINASVLAIGLLTIISSVIIFYRMKCNSNSGYAGIALFRRAKAWKRAIQ
jgi:hypothetical protein